MTLLRFAFQGAMLAVLPVLAACNQTAAPDAAPAVTAESPQVTPGVVGSGAVAAIMDMQETRTRHQLTATMATRAAAFDRTGISASAIQEMYEQQGQIERQKIQHMMTEVEKAVEEAKALQALSEDLERQKAASGAGRSTSRRTPTP